MARMPTGSPRTVDDPDAADYARMVSAQRFRNGLIETGLPPARTRKSGIGPQSVADTAGEAGDVATVMQLIPEGLHQFGSDRDALKGAYKAVKKTNGILGPVLTATQDIAQYKADRARGMPADEAAIKNIGGMVLGTGLGGYVEAETLPLGPLVATGVGWAGNKDGHMFAQSAAEGWRGLKAFGQQVGRTTSEGLSRLNRPSQSFYDRMYRQ